jgi:exopolyphosphatase / guanosine-5'-triphosphate,3'-diphosphate pyrophosphatase
MRESGGRGGERRGSVGVIDIGSNSVRLVVFEAAARNPVTLFNEKAICAIGRNMVSSGRLDAEGMRLALAALTRFRAVAQGIGVKRLVAVATAAARDAKNGASFIEKARAACGVPIRVLSGAEEAEYAALGVIAGLPEADGVAGDLGGGSLELATVSAGRIGPGTTLPFGPLRLMDASGGRLLAAERLVDEGLLRVPGIEKLKGRTLYAVGGVWRNLARIHMHRTGYPLHILHGYELSRIEVLRICEFVRSQSPRALERLPDVPKRRTEALPFGALVLERLVRLGQLDKVVVSAFGVREGVLFKGLPPSVRQSDPLLEASAQTALLFGRRAAQVDEVQAFTAPLFADEDAIGFRLRKAACLLADSAWRQHPDYRADLAFRYVLQAQIAGIDHKARAFLALCLWYRYGGDTGHEMIDPVERLAGFEKALRAERLGRALRLAFVLSGSAQGTGRDFALSLGPRYLKLLIAKRRAGVVGEPVERRLEELAFAFARDPKIVVKR